MVLGTRDFAFQIKCLFRAGHVDLPLPPDVAAPKRAPRRPRRSHPSRLGVELAQGVADALGEADGAERRQEVDGRLDQAEAEAQAQEHDPLGAGDEADLAGRAQGLGARPDVADQERAEAAAGPAKGSRRGPQGGDRGRVLESHSK